MFYLRPIAMVLQINFTEYLEHRENVLARLTPQFAKHRTSSCLLQLEMRELACTQFEFALFVTMRNDHSPCQVHLLFEAAILTRVGDTNIHNHSSKDARRPRREIVRHEEGELMLN